MSPALITHHRVLGKSLRSVATFILPKKTFFLTYRFVNAETYLDLRQRSPLDHYQTRLNLSLL